MTIDVSSTALTSSMFNGLISLSSGFRLSTSRMMFLSTMPPPLVVYLKIPRIGTMMPFLRWFPQDNLVERSVTKRNPNKHRGQVGLARAIINWGLK